MIHELKTLPVPFAAVWEDKKSYEVRRFDRDFQVGDSVFLREYHQDIRGYSGRSIFATITYMTPPGCFGLPSDIGVLGIRLVRKKHDDPIN